MIDWQAWETTVRVPRGQVHRLVRKHSVSSAGGSTGERDAGA